MQKIGAGGAQDRRHRQDLPSDVYGRSLVKLRDHVFLYLGYSTSSSSPSPYDYISNLPVSLRFLPSFPSSKFMPEPTQLSDPCCLP